jgi:hypothetical protein
MANDLNKTLSITIDTKLTGEDAFKRLQGSVDSTEVSIKKFSTTMYTTADGVDKYIHRFDLASQSTKKLKEEIDKLNRQLTPQNVNAGGINSNAFREEVDKAAQLANLFRTQSRTRLQELTNQLTLEKSIRVNGLNDIKTKVLQAAQAEQDIRQNLSYKLLTIEESLRQGIISSARQAEQARIQAVQQAAKEITNIREAVERRQASIAGRVARTDIFRRETDERIRELDRQLALEQARRVNGHNSRQALELEAADKEYRIRKALADRLIQIDESIRKGVSAGRDPNTGRFLNADTARAQALAKAYREIDQVNKDLANSTNLAANSHGHLAFRVLELIGLYKLWTFAINGVYNAITSIPKVGIELDTTRAALASTIGSYEAGIGVLTALEREAQRTGIAIGTLRENFRNFSASTTLAGESLDTTWRIFTDINTVITALHLPAEKAQLTFLALSQVFNKTKVQSEELVKQLGNLLPGAFTAFFEANKLVEKTLTDGTRIWEGSFKSRIDMIKQMANGTVFAHDTMLRFADFMAERFIVAFNVASDGLNANLGRLDTQITLLKESLYDLTAGRMNEIVKGLTRFASELRESAETGGFLITIIKGITYTLTAGLIVGIGTLLARLGPVQAAVLGFVRALSSLRATGLAVAGIMPAISAALSGLASSPALLATIASTAVLAISNYKTQAQKTVEDIFSSIRAAKEAVEDFRNQQRKDEGLQINIEENREVIKARQRLEQAQQLANKTIFEKTFDNIAVGFLQGTEALYKFRQETKAATDNLGILQDNLDKTREKATIEIKVEADNALQDIASIAEKMRVEMLRATGRTEEANILQFEITNRENLKAAEGVIAKFNNLFKNPQGQALPYTPTPELEERARVAQEYIDNYKIAKEHINDLNKTTVNGIKDLYARSQAELENSIKDIESRTKAFVDNITYTTSLAKKGLELDETVGRGVDKSNIIRLENNAKVAAIREQIKLEREKQALIRSTSQEQINFTNKQISSIEKGFKLIGDIETRGIKDSQARARAVSPTGALGQYQIQPSTLRQYTANVPKIVLDLEVKAKGLNKVGKELDDFSKKTLADFAESHQKEIEAAALKHFTGLVQAYKFDFVKAAAAYNAGEGRVNSAIKKSGGGDITPFVPKETQQYIALYVDALSKGNTEQKGILKNSLAFEESVRKVASLENEINLTYADREISLAKITKERAQFLENVQLDYLRTTGQEAQAESLALQIEYREKLAFLQKNGTEADIKNLNLLFERKLINADLLSYTARTTQAQNLYNLAIQRVNTEINSGNVTQLAGFRQINEATKQYLTALDAEIEQVNKLLVGRETDIALLTKKLELEQQIAQITANTGTGKQLRDQATDAVFPGFSDAGNDFQTKRANLEKDTINQQTELTKLYNTGQIQHQEYYDSLAEIEDNYRANSKINTFGYFKGMFSVGANTFMELTIASQKMYGEQSKQARAAFAAYKAARIAEAVMSTAAAVTAQLAAGPYIGFVLAGLAAAMGAVQIATIAAQPMPSAGAAHGGLDNVPKEQTYLLDKGERVLSPNQNKDLTNFLKAKPEQPNNVVPMKQDIKIVNAIDTSSLDEYLVGASAEKIIKNIIRQEAS